MRLGVGTDLRAYSDEWFERAAEYLAGDTVDLGAIGDVEGTDPCRRRHQGSFKPPEASIE